jgi:hypothetical protein
MRWGRSVRCRVCGDATRNHGDGRCRRCYQYFWRHGYERPALTARQCTVCGTAPHYARGWCRRHYQWSLRHGWVEPPPEDAPRICQTCGRHCDWGPRSYIRQRCSACYSYRQKQGRERPAHLWRRQEGA